MKQKTPQTKAQKRENMMRKETPKKANININEERHLKEQKLMSKNPQKKLSTKQKQTHLPANTKGFLEIKPKDNPKNLYEI